MELGSAKTSGGNIAAYEWTFDPDADARDYEDIEEIPEEKKPAKKTAKKSAAKKTTTKKTAAKKPAAKKTTTKKTTKKAAKEAEEA